MIDPEVRIEPDAVEDQGEDLALFDTSKLTKPVDLASLVDRYMVPPFTVLDRRQGYWKQRARQWKGLGIESELGRSALRRNSADSGVWGDFQEGITTYSTKESIGEYPKTQGLSAEDAAKRQKARREALKAEAEAKGWREPSEAEAAARQTKQKSRAFNTGANPVFGTGSMTNKRTTKDAAGEEAGDYDQRRRPGRSKSGEPKTSGGEASVATMSHLTGGKSYKMGEDGEVIEEGYSGNYSLARDASIFDPVLCELTYHWYCPKGGLVLDPFAGGSVRGIMASALGRRYVGVDLSGPQCVANRVQAETIIDNEEERPIWIEGDSADVLTKYMGDEADLLFTCPPYGNLEVYSDDPRDLSTMDLGGFARTYFEILKAAVFAMKPNSFQVIVVGNYRDRKTGILNDLVGLTVRAFHAAGAEYYNEAVILDPIGTAAVRAPGVFNAARKLVRVHQNYLVFTKGDPKLATAPLSTVYDTEDVE